MKHGGIRDLECNFRDWPWCPNQLAFCHCLRGQLTCSNDTTTRLEGIRMYPKRRRANIYFCFVFSRDSFYLKSIYIFSFFHFSVFILEVPVFSAYASHETLNLFTHPANLLLYRL